MVETPAIATESSKDPEMPPPHHDNNDRRSERLHPTLAWIGVIAGVVFTVAVIFFSGFVLGRSSGGHHGWNRDYQGGQMGRGGSGDDCPMMRQGGMMGSGGGMGPGSMMDPDDMGPGPMMQPGQELPPPPPKPSPAQRP